MTTTLVTAGDKRFFWGLFLLVASVRKHGMDNPIKCLVKGLSDQEEAALAQFDVTVCRSEDIERPLQAQKPTALLLGLEDSDYATWIDGDCVVEGNISELLLPNSPNEVMIRFRDRVENKLRFQTQDEDGGIPASIQKTWREDVGEADYCNIETTCVTNAFTLHKSHKDLIHHWDTQIQHVASKHAGHFPEAYSHSSGKGISDELILNSLFGYSKANYQFTPYLLAEEADRCLLHFGLNPKPWEMWIHSTLQYYKLVFSILDWAQEKGYDMPARPLALISAYKPIAFSWAVGYEFARKTARGLRSRLRSGR